jgi:hypothetical protein
MVPGQALDLDHRDDRAGYLGMSHSRCNRQAGGRLGNERRRAQRERTIAMVNEITIAIEISEDRRRTSVVAAGKMPGGLVLLELCAYLAGTDPTAAVLQLQRERTVLAVVVDPHSPGATSIAPLEAAGVKVAKPSSSDLAVAHGSFLDGLDAGRIRHRGQPELTAAMRHLEQRRLGGASAPERRGARVDVAPAVAAELAVWALTNTPTIALPAIY